MTDGNRNTTAVMNSRGNLKWLLDTLTDVKGVQHAIVLSTDGILMERSDGLSRDDADQLAAQACAIQSVSRGVCDLFQAGPVQQNVVEMKHGLLFVTAAGDGACLAVFADVEADMGRIGYEMNRLVQRVREHMSAAPRGATATGTDERGGTQPHG